MKKANLNRRGMALPIVFIFLVISQIVYMGLLRLNQLNMQHYRLFQQHYVASIQVLLTRAQLTPSPETLATQWERHIREVQAAQFNQRFGTASFTWLTEESYQMGALQMDDGHIVVFEQTIEVLDGDFEVEHAMSSELLRLQIEADGFTLLEEIQSEDRGEWQAPLVSDAHFIFNTGEVTHQSHRLWSVPFHSDARVERFLPRVKCSYSVKWRVFFYQGE